MKQNKKLKIKKKVELTVFLQPVALWEACFV